MNNLLSQACLIEIYGDKVNSWKDLITKEIKYGHTFPKVKFHK